MASRLGSGLLLCTLLAPLTPAQFELPPSVSHTSWTAVDGLPQDSVTGIGQDSAGYLWVGTYGGLGRFDGRYFEVFDILSRSDLPSNRFSEILIGRDGVLWVWAHRIGLFRYTDDRFTYVETPQDVRQLVEAEEGCLWAVLADGVFHIGEDRVELVRAGSFQRMLVAEDGAIWVSTSEGTLLRIDDGGDETVFGPDAGLPPKQTMLALLQDDDGLLWGGCPQGVWRSTDVTKTSFERVDRAPVHVNAMAQDERGAFWFGCRDKLVRLDPETGAALEVARGNFTRFFEDDRGNLWAGSRGQGLHCLRYSALHGVNTELCSEADDTWAITEDWSGTVFILFDRLLCSLRGGEATGRHLDDNLRALLVGREGDLWVGMGRGLLRIREDHETAYGEDDGLHGTVRVLLEDLGGGVWVGTVTGLFRMEGDRFVRQFPEQLAGIRCLLEDEVSRTLWVGTPTGLARIDGASLSWLTAEDGLSPGVVRALHLDPDGVLWAGTYGGGLNRIENGTIVRYSRDNGLADNFISCILEDDDGRLWINSNRGPFVVLRSELNRVAYGETDRIACTSFTRGDGAREANGGGQPSGWRTADGAMWFTSIEGVTVADPRVLPLDEAPPRALIESLELDENRKLDVRFTALDFSSPERVRIQYRLEGNDAGWIECVGERTARYNYLPSGDYDFQVRARNGYGPWSGVVSRRLEVESRFHETTAFLVCIALFGALGATLLAGQRLKRARARTAELMQLVDERERAERSLSKSQVVLRRLSRELLTNQDTERRRLSRELHDDLSQRLAALAMEAQVARRYMGDRIDQAREQLDDVVQMARQLAIDVQLLSRRLHPVGLRTLGLSEAVRQECEAFTRRGGVAIELEEGIVWDEVPEDVAVAAFRILQESLHNIEKHARAGAVKVRVAVEGDVLVLSVADRGQGFDIENSASAGLGLVTMRERAASIAGELSVESSPGVGTTVCLRVPERRKRE